MPWKVMHYAAESVSLGTWIFEARERREPGRMQIEAIFLEKDMEVHVLWP